MKVILAGSTGHIGAAVLAECLADPAITSLILLVRRHPPNLVTNPKTTVIIVPDFTAYVQKVIETIQSADAAIWCLGTFNGDRRVDIDFPLTFINHVKSRQSAKHFRFVQLGGAFTEPPTKPGEQGRSLWYFSQGRRVRGAAEAAVLQTAEGMSPEQLEVYLVKPGGVFSAGAVNRFLQRYVVGGNLSVMADELAKVMVLLAKKGHEQKVFLSREIAELGRQL